MPADADNTTGTIADPADANERRLVAELEDARAHVQRLEEEYNALLADPAVIQEDRDSTRILLEGARHNLATAERALERHRAGTYGRCSRCGAEIPPERLEALPEADTCVACS